MSGIDYTKLTDEQLLALHAAGGDLSKLSDKDLMGIHDSLNPSVGKQISDAAGTTYDYIRTQANKYLMAPVAGIPRAVAEGVDWLGRQDAEKGGTGARPPNAAMDWVRRNLPTAGEAETALNKPHMPYSAIWDSKALEDWKKVKDTPRPEVGINPVVDAAVGGLLSAPFTGVTTLAGLGANIGAPVLSETLGEITKGTPYETPARVIGAIGGAGAGYGIGMGVKKGWDVAKAAVAPMTEAGRDAGLGRVLVDASANPNAAITNIDNYVAARAAGTDAVPDFKIGAGKASRDGGLSAIEEVAAAKTPGMRATVQENNRLATEALDKAFTGLPTAADAPGVVQSALANRYKLLDAERAAAADPLYEAARNSAVKIDPTQPWMYAKSIAETEKDAPQALMNRVAKLYETGAETPQQMMAARRAISGMFNEGDIRGDRYLRSLLKGALKETDASLSVVPEELAARAKFAEKSVPLEPFGKGTTAGNIVKMDPTTKQFVQPVEKAVSDLSPRAVQNVLMASGGDPAVKAAYQSAFFNDFKRAALSSVQEDAAGNRMLLAAGANKWLEKNAAAAANVMTPDQIKALKDVARNLADQAQTVPGRTGSQTFDRLASESIIGALVNPKFADAPILYPVRKALNLIYGGANEKMMERLFEVIQDPKVTSALMKKATAGNVKMAEPVLARLGVASTPQISRAGGE